MVLERTGESVTRKSLWRSLHILCSCGDAGCAVRGAGEAVRADGKRHLMADLPTGPTPKSNAEQCERPHGRPARPLHGAFGRVCRRRSGRCLRLFGGNGACGQGRAEHAEGLPPPPAAPGQTRLQPFLGPWPHHAGTAQRSGRVRRAAPCLHTSRVGFGGSRALKATDTINPGPLDGRRSARIRRVAPCRRLSPGGSRGAQRRQPRAHEPRPTPSCMHTPAPRTTA